MDGIVLTLLAKLATKAGGKKGRIDASRQDSAGRGAPREEVGTKRRAKIRWLELCLRSLVIYVAARLIGRMPACATIEFPNMDGGRFWAGTVKKRISRAKAEQLVPP